MAENNSSAPLKTAEGAEHPHLIALRTIAEYPATDSLMNMDAANMRRIAAQAVAAQAAPAAVATPDQIAFLNSDRDGWIEAHAKIYRAYQDLRNAADDLLTCVMHDGVLVDPEHPKRIAVEAVKAALCTTPALPATEDSSAGDLAEVQAEPVSSDPVAWHSKLYGTCWMHKQPYHLDAGTHFFVRGNPNPVATVLSGAAIQWHTGTAALEHGTFFYTAPQAQPADALTRAALDVLAERARQIGKEGYVPEADDSYVDAELAAAAATYALLATGADGWRVDDHWPWAQDSLKKGDARRMLEKAGALILAEMERLDRAAKAAAQEGGNA